MAGSIFQRKTLRSFLVERKIYSPEQYDSLLNDKPGNKTEFEYFAEKATNDQELQPFLDFAEVKKVPLLEIRIPKEVLKEIPRDLLLNNKIFPFGYENNDPQKIQIAMSNPNEKDVLEIVSIRIGKDVIPYYAPTAEIEQQLSKNFGDAAASEAAMAYIKTLSPAAASEENLAADVNSPVVTIVNSMFEQAARMKASDIHIEPFENILRIRYRIDGALVERPSYPIQMHSAIIARLKIMGGLNIAEKRIPQDGRITFMVDNVEYDIRVSMLPTVYGEKCVMRLTIRSNLQMDKKNLGLTKYDLKIFDHVFANPNGIILVTGPTGSGKSTTLYTALSELNTEDVNIITVEDPVEANIFGVNQVQTNAQAGLTFASALRSILRQDPDIIMIGEIRDGETAEIATQAAITGHLVVSTLHTNSSASAVTRLVNMGIEPYLVADSVVGIMAQRLVKKLCPKCKVARTATEEEMRELGIKQGVAPITIYDKCGCAYCNQTGYKGRTAVYEIMDISPEIKRLIVAGGSTEAIRDAAVKNGMHTLHKSAAMLVAQGVTTMQEMRKVSSDI